MCGVVTKLFNMEPTLLLSYTSPDSEAMKLVSEKPKNPLTVDQALFNFTKTMLGTGMLSLPLAYRNAGLWTAFLLTPVVCLVCLYSMHIMADASDYIANKRGVTTRLDYANVVRAVVELGPSWISNHGYLAKQITNGTIWLTQFGLCCVYSIFMAENLRQVFDSADIFFASTSEWIAIISVPILLICSIRDLATLSPIALAFTFVYFTAFAIVITYLFIDPLPITEIRSFGSWQGFPLFFGTVTFAFEGIAVLMPIYDRIEDRYFFKAWNGVLNTGTLITLVLYEAVGFYGYLKFGDQVSETITLNLPNNVFFWAVKVMFVGCILVSYALQLYVVMERVEKWVTRKIVPEFHTFLFYGVRYVTILSAGLIAACVPHLDLVIALVGAFSTTAFGIIYPPIVQLLICYSENNITGWTIIRFTCLVIFALIGCATGTYTALSSIIERMAE